MFSPLLDVLADVPDPRRAEGKLYKLPHVLLFSILAIVAGCNSYRGRLLLGSGVVPGLSRNQAGHERAEQGFAASTRVVHELEEAKIKGQLVLRDAAVRAQPGAQQRLKSFHGVDVDLAEPVPVLVAGVFAAGMADRFMPVAPV